MTGGFGVWHFHIKYGAGSAPSLASDVIVNGNTITRPLKVNDTAHPIWGGGALTPCLPPSRRLHGGCLRVSQLINSTLDYFVSRFAGALRQPLGGCPLGAAGRQEENMQNNLRDKYCIAFALSDEPPEGEVWRYPV